MVLIIASSTAGFSINRHYCGGKEKSKAVILDADKCAFESKSVCIRHEATTLTKKACCSDHSDFYKQYIQVDLGDNDIQEIDEFQIAQALNPTADNLQKVRSENDILVYRPPPLKEPLFVLFQSFLL